jgi:hypothetical protein
MLRLLEFGLSYTWNVGLARLRAVTGPAENLEMAQIIAATNGEDDRVFGHRC